MPYTGTPEDLPNNLGGTWVDPDPDHAQRVLATAKARSLAILTAPPDPKEHTREAPESQAAKRARAIRAQYRLLGDLPDFDL